MLPAIWLHVFPAKVAYLFLATWLHLFFQGPHAIPFKPYCSMLFQQNCFIFFKLHGCIVSSLYGGMFFQGPHAIPFKPYGCMLFQQNCVTSLSRMAACFSSHMAASSFKGLMLYLSSNLAACFSNKIAACFSSHMAACSLFAIISFKPYGCIFCPAELLHLFQATWLHAFSKATVLYLSSHIAACFFQQNCCF